ncbi:MAG: tetratricopeptide repeat protein [Paracoccaceae bacterium]
MPARWDAMTGNNDTDIDIEGSPGAKAAGRDQYNIGLTFEEHQKALEKREAQIRADLERAHAGEKDVLQRELSAIGGKLANAEADYRQTLAELAEIKKQLARYDNQMDAAEKKSAFDALDRGDRSIADALFAALEKKAQARADDALEDAAEMAYQQGLIAEQDVRWQEAHADFARAARLMPNFERLSKVRQLLYRLGEYARAAEMGEQIFDACRLEFAEQSTEFAGALNDQALMLQYSGKMAKAEPLFRQAIEIDKATIGEGHPDYATRLNNLAGLLRAMGRYEEAEPLYRQAIKIDKATIGEGHPDYATRLNNLAALLRAMGRYEEAEPLFREAMETTKAALGKGHPSYAIRLNNLAALLRDMGRYEEAEPLYREAIKIDKATIGEGHPGYANGLNNLAGLLQDMGKPKEARALFAESLAIFRKALGEDHPNTKQVAGNYAKLLRQHFPDDPALAELEAVFGEDIGT